MKCAARLVSLLVPAAAVAGCNQFLAQRMVAPPNGGRSDVATTAPTDRADVQRCEISVGPPHATLAVWVLSPRADKPVRGTILLLHGFLNDHSQVQPVAQSLRSAGYRAVLVDLRGHGQSTGDHITYGVDDSRDLVQVTDYLQAHHLCGKSLGVFGVSYGAASALLYAGNDPRVQAVVAVAPFANLREEAPYFGRHILPIPGLFLSAADYSSIVNTMGELASFNPDACSPIAAIRKTSAHVRLFHGDADMIIPCACSKELAAAAPDRTELTIFPGQGHLEVSFNFLDELSAPTRAWFDQYLPAEK